MSVSDGRAQTETSSEMTTPRPWRKKRESLDADHPERGPERWEIVAGKETNRRNMGHFHPDDATYSKDEFHVVEFDYDRDYGSAGGGIENEADADLIVAAVNERESLLSRLTTAEQERKQAWSRADAAEAAIADLTPSPDGSYGRMNAASWKDAYIERLLELASLRELLTEAIGWIDGDFTPTEAEHYDFVTRARAALACPPPEEGQR